MPDAKKGETTKERILKVARELFAKKGYAGVSMDEIAEKVGIKKASLYHHFESKQQIYNTIIERAIREVSGILEMSFAGKDVVEGAREFSIKIHEFIRENTDYIKIMIREVLDENIPVREITRKYIPIILKFGVQILEEGQKKGVFRKSVEPNHLAVTVAGAILIYFLLEPIVEVLIGKITKKSVRERALHVFDVIVNGLRADNPKQKGNPKIAK